MTHEPRIDWLPLAALALPGRLGMTRAPGRWSPGRHLDSDVRLRRDLEVIARDHGAKVLVTLLEPAEIAELGNLRAAARRARLAWLHFPIPDMSIPRDVAATRKLVGRILAALEGGDHVVVHCWGGLGRTGTIAAACLVARGRAAAEALALVRAARQGAVEVPAQVRFVEELAAASR